MKTTIDIPDSLLQEAKTRAACDGISRCEFFARVLSQALERKPRTKGAGTRIQLPLVPSRTPGSLDLTSESIGNLLEADDLDVLAKRQWLADPLAWIIHAIRRERA